MTSPAFIPAAPLRAPSTSATPRCRQGPATGVSMSAESVVDKYFPTYVRNRAPTIVITGKESVSLSMAPIAAFTDVDKTAAPLLDYSDPDDFVVNKPVPPSAISWPSGDGRSDPDFVGVKGRFNQPNLTKYGPFPDFFKVSCHLPSHLSLYISF